jgi:hypothetical protein
MAQSINIIFFHKARVNARKSWAREKKKRNQIRSVVPAKRYHVQQQRHQQSTELDESILCRWSECTGLTKSLLGTPNILNKADPMLQFHGRLVKVGPPGKEAAIESGLKFGFWLEDATHH